MQNSIIQYPQPANTDEYLEIWLAGGCFWGTEHYFLQVKGIVATAVGYANGASTGAPTYEQVCAGTTGFAEAVYLRYDPKKLSLPFILELYYKSVNPYTKIGKGETLAHNIVLESTIQTKRMLRALQIV